jgi:translation elongation factor P/translation initiation factor 5A
MKKLAKDLKKGDRIKIAEQTGVIDSIELSEIGKHGRRKCRIVAVTEKGEKVILIRPEDYPFDLA